MVTTRSQARAHEAPIAAFPDVRVAADSSTPSVSQTRPISIHSDSRSTIGTHFSEAPDGDVPPTYTIDLSLPPQQRYVDLALAYKAELLSLTSLFDEVAASTGISNVALVKSAARLLLRGLHSHEQTEELRGIANAVGLEMYLLVAFNTLLDLFMGCTSGGVRTRAGPDAPTARMVHFRTLDWGMEALRRVAVTLAFVRRRGGPVVARALSYVGFVGVLTAVRPGLSVSLNFRPTHDASSAWRAARFRAHQLLVLLGRRPSVAALLRAYIVPAAPRRARGKAAASVAAAPEAPELAELERTFPGVPSTAAYVVASDGARTTVFEKDRSGAAVRSSRAFIVATNHDAAMEPAIAAHAAAAAAASDGGAGARRDAPVTAELRIGGVELRDGAVLLDMLAESLDRAGCMRAKWEEVERRFGEAGRAAAGGERRAGEKEEREEPWVDQDTVVRWLCEYPTTNEMTHFACVMDPTNGEIVWSRRWEEPAYVFDDDEDTN